jgi:tetratricopeptide (TPR) repeat protein
MEQEQYERASDQFRKVSVAEGFPEKMLGEYHAVRTDFYLRQDRLEDAIEELEKSINYTRKRQVKTRRMFLLAQLYDEQGDGPRSTRLFAEVIARNPDYEMAFYAKINRALAYDVTAGKSDDIKEILFDMIKDEKNAEFLDQIYYALAEIELKEGHEEQGIAYLKLATQKSVRNGNAKGLAYYRLAEIYFGKPVYDVAQTYYDSTVAFLSTEHPDYDMVLARANSLTQMMRDINIVKEQDSLQAFAKLPKKEQEQIIEMKIQDVIQAEKDAEREKELEELRGQQAKFEQNNQFNQNARSGDWYFYNPGAVSFGAQEFKRIWGGNRKNEDDWRRTDKTSSAPLLIEGDGAILAEDTIDGANDPKNENYYWKQVPDTDEKMQRSNQLIVEALYDLGLVYKEQMNDLPPAAETFEELIARYDSSKYHPTCYYQLYRLYQEMGNTAKAEYYKGQVVSNYPQSDFAKVILNPDYAAQEEVQTQAVQKVYEQAYVLFNQGFYTKSYEYIVLAEEKYPNSTYQPQLSFLKALCIGYLEGEQRMIDALKEVGQKYGGSDVGVEAKEIVAYLEGNTENDNTANQANAEQQEAIDAAKSRFEYDVGAAHNFILIVPDTMSSTNVQLKLSDFNRKYFSTKGFKTSMIPLKDGANMFIVSNVGYATKAMDYYSTFTNAKEMKTLLNPAFPRFVISYNNYAQFYKDQNVEAYAAFFDENYNKTN